MRPIRPTWPRLNAIQDGLRIEAASARPFEPTDYDPASLDATRHGAAGRGKGGLDTRGDVRAA